MGCIISDTGLGRPWQFWPRHWPDSNMERSIWFADIIWRRRNDFLRRYRQLFDNRQSDPCLELQRKDAVWC